MWCAVHARYAVVMLLALALSIVYGLRACMGVMVLFMVNSSQIRLDGWNYAMEQNCSPFRPSPEEQKSDYEELVAGKVYPWGPVKIGGVLCAYFVGYCVCQYPALLIAVKFNPKWVLFIAVAANVVCCVLTPVLCYVADWIGVFVVRCLQGIFSALSIPAVHVIVERWAPPEEKTLYTLVIYAGTSLGLVFATLFSALLARSLSWPLSFFLLAVLGAPWLVLWGIWGAEEPRRMRKMRDSEIAFIDANREMYGVVPWEQRKEAKFPCKAAFRSLPFWAIIVAHFCSNIGWYSTLLFMPYIIVYAVQFFPVRMATFLALLYFLMWVIALDLGWILSLVVDKEKISVGTARKIANGISSLVPGVCYLLIAFITCDPLSLTVPLVLGVASMGALSVGVIANPLDLAPHFGGELIAITNTFASLPGIFMPFILGNMLASTRATSEWLPVLIFIFIAYLVMFIFYSIFGSGEVQPWNEFEDVPEDEVRKKVKPTEVSA